MTFKSIPIAALALALAGCGTVNRGLESVHQPVVQRTDFVIDVATGGAGLAAGERERLDGWFRSLNLAYGDRVSVDDPSGQGEVRSDVAAVLSKRGMLLAGEAPVTPGAVTPGYARVIVTRSSATVPGCPDWSRQASPEFVGSTMSNYGCASNAALAAMIADPMDLVSGRNANGANDPDASAKAIRAYRQMPTTGQSGLKIESTGKGGSK